MGRAHADGRLVRLMDGEELPNGLVRVTADLIEPAPSDRWRRLRPWLVGAAVLVSGAALAAVVWLVVLAVLDAVVAVTAAVTWVQAHRPVIGGAALMLAVLGGGGASCADGHCGGCRR